MGFFCFVGEVSVKSRIYPISKLISKAKVIIKAAGDDKITVHAAEASFFAITSAVPFLSLFIAIIGILIPGMPEIIPSMENSSAAFAFIVDKIYPAPGISLISFSAITALWSASRGVGAIRGGIETVYRAERAKNYIVRRIKSIISTVIFISALTSISILSLFGDLLILLLLGDMSHTISKFKTPIFICALTLLFAFVYARVATRSEIIRKKFIYHIPGALFSALGWVIFSYFYSLYTSNFPGASYIYGSLGAICLIMLWIYFCMIIFLFGAEINKLLFTRN